MNKDLVPYQPSIDIKELGFDEPCFGSYVKLTETQNTFFMNEVVSEIDRETPLHESLITKAPTFSQAFRWFREKYELFCWIEKFHVDETYIFQIPPANFTKIQGHYITYEEAELACLLKLIEIVKTK